MSFKKIATSAAVITGLLAANLSPLATAANAGEGWRNHDGRNYSRRYDGPRHRYAYRRDRNHNGKNIAKGIAIGLGVLAVGAILASEAHR